MTLKATDRGRAAAIAVRAGVDVIDRELAKRLSPAELRTFRAGLVALYEIGAALEKEPVSEIRWNTVRAAIKSMSSPEFG